MVQLKKGTKLSCVPCGREVVVDACGISEQTIWCCGKPMAQKKRVLKGPHRKATRKK